MCGHGMIGVAETLKHQKRIDQGIVPIETPVGRVDVEVHADESVSIQNVASFRSDAGVTVHVDGLGKIIGDIAWGGNWFFLVSQPSFAIPYLWLEG